MKRQKRSRGEGGPELVHPALATAGPLRIDGMPVQKDSRPTLTFGGVDTTSKRSKRNGGKRRLTGDYPQPAAGPIISEAEVARAEARHRNQGGRKDHRVPMFSDSPVLAVRSSHKMDAKRRPVTGSVVLGEPPVQQTEEGAAGKKSGGGEETGEQEEEEPGILCFPTNDIDAVEEHGLVASRILPCDAGVPFTVALMMDLSITATVSYVSASNVVKAAPSASSKHHYQSRLRRYTSISAVYRGETHHTMGPLVSAMVKDWRLKTQKQPPKPADRMKLHGARSLVVLVSDFPAIDVQATIDANSRRFRQSVNFGFRYCPGTLVRDHPRSIEELAEMNQTLPTIVMGTLPRWMLLSKALTGGMVMAGGSLLANEKQQKKKPKKIQQQQPESRRKKPWGLELPLRVYYRGYSPGCSAQLLHMTRSLNQHVITVDLQYEGCNVPPVPVGTLSTTREKSVNEMAGAESVEPGAEAEGGAEAAPSNVEKDMLEEEQLALDETAFSDDDSDADGSDNDDEYDEEEQEPAEHGSLIVGDKAAGGTNGREQEPTTSADLGGGVGALYSGSSLIARMRSDIVQAVDSPALARMVNQKTKVSVLDKLVVRIPRQRENEDEGEKMETLSQDGENEEQEAEYENWTIEELLQCGAFEYHFERCYRSLTSPFVFKLPDLDNPNLRKD